MNQLHHYAHHLIQLLPEENNLNEGSRGLVYNIAQATYKRPVTNSSHTGYAGGHCFRLTAGS